jgi:adenylate cyclase
MSKTQNPPSPANEKITHQLQRMLASPDFNATPQQILFLKFVVNQTLAGKAREIKDYTVAAEVFGRGPDFDRSIDPIVSIQADMLRRVLARYYETSGRNDPIRIDIPPGTCVPVFEKRFHTQTTDTAIDGLNPDISVKSS